MVKISGRASAATGADGGKAYFVDSKAHAAGDVAERDDHRAAARAVADVPPRPKEHQVAQIGKHLPRPSNEIGKAGVARTDKSPGQPSDKDDADDIPRPNMDAQEIVLGEVCDSERRHQRPMPDTDERVPDANKGYPIHPISPGP